MTTRERILTLADDGHEAHVIAALLNLEVTDVAETLALPGHTPADPAGGGASPVNWCIVSLALRTLNGKGGRVTYRSADLTITAQSGSDFSIGGNEEEGAIISAAGGRFQALAYVRPPSFPELDGGSSKQRYFGFALGMAPRELDDPESPNILVGGVGFDAFVPVEGAPEASHVSTTPISVIGYCSPGKAVCYSIEADLVNGFGTDVVPTDGIGSLTIWQV